MIIEQEREHPLVERGPRIKYVLQLIIYLLFPEKFTLSREMDDIFAASREALHGHEAAVPC